jgi:hypothetical protein
MHTKLFIDNVLDIACEANIECLPPPFGHSCRPRRLALQALDQEWHLPAKPPDWRTNDNRALY